jgi:hypothetical protein
MTTGGVSNAYRKSGNYGILLVKDSDAWVSSVVHAGASLAVLAVLTGERKRANPSTVNDETSNST